MRCPFYSLFTIYYFLWPPPDRKRPCVGILTACHFLQKPWLTFTAHLFVLQSESFLSSIICVLYVFFNK